MQSALTTLTPLAATHPTAVIDGHNQLALLYTQRAHYHKAIDHLNTAQKAFQSIKHTLTPLSSTSSSTTASSSGYTAGQQRVIQRLHTMTLYYLAQTYAKIDKRTLSAYYCHICLNRQIQAADNNNSTSTDSESTAASDSEQERLDWREWVVNAMGLGMWYEEQQDWESAWHCVKAAECVLSRVKEGDDEHDKEKRRELAGEVDKSVAGFYLKFIQHRPAADNSPLSDSTATTTTMLRKPIRFASLSLPAMPCSHPLTFPTALQLFNAAYRHYHSALTAFPLDGYVTEHCQLLLDLASLYRSLILYDGAHETVYVKKAVAVLSKGMEGLSSVHFVGLYREMSEELGNGYMMLMDAAKPAKAGSNSSSGCNKRNEYGMKAIHHYQLFANTFLQTKQTDGEGAGQKEKHVVVEAEDMYKYLLVQFTVARLYQRLWTNNVTSMCTFHKKSLDILQNIVKLCNDWQCVSLFANELEMCKEMIELLPRKMEKMLKDGATFQV